MFFTIQTIARHEFLALRKQKTFTLLLCVFLVMTLFSTYIGWSTRHTILSIYDETVKQMAAGGITEIPVNPFLAAPALSVLKNMVVYVLLIGTLLSIIVGHSAFARERRAGVVKILFSKPFSRTVFVLGKMAGILFVLALVMAASFIISLLSVSLISSRLLSMAETFRLFVFYGVSLEYVLGFAMLGFLFSITAKSESLALLIPVMIWVLINFVMPQLSSALDPASLLNPTSIRAVLPQSHFFTTIRTVIAPVSISESYKLMGQTLLESDNYVFPVWSSIIFLVILVACCVHAIKKFNVCEKEITE
ncbi:MAG: ABC transporter permease [Deltaproteobacteria bacterium]|nr:ABC transporter permease [Deltaproteobacteria bacterium]